MPWRFFVVAFPAPPHFKPVKVLIYSIRELGFTRSDGISTMPHVVYALLNDMEISHHENAPHVFLYHNKCLYL